MVEQGKKKKKKCRQVEHMIGYIPTHFERNTKELPISTGEIKSESKDSEFCLDPHRRDMSTM